MKRGTCQGIIKEGPVLRLTKLGRATLHGSHQIVNIKRLLLVPSLRFVGHAGTEGARQIVQKARGKSRPGRPQEAWQGTHAESRRPVARSVNNSKEEDTQEGCNAKGVRQKAKAKRQRSEERRWQSAARAL